MQQQTLALIFILGSSAAIMAWIIFWAIPADRKRKEKSLRELDDAPFNVVSRDEKNAELGEMYASNAERYRRHRDGA